MILAAGKGERLRPLTNSIPKAMVPIHQTPALAWLIRRLTHLGTNRIAINTHYRADVIQDYIEQCSSTLPQITLFFEKQLLGTGGGILATKNYWEDSSLIVHNVDVFCSANLQKIFHHHKTQENWATLLTQDRPTQTRLLIDEAANICGIHYYKTNDYRLVRKPQGQLVEQGFNGIQFISTKIFPLCQYSGEFSIIDFYLDLCSQELPIKAYDIGSAYWKDFGTPEKLKQLETDWNKLPELRLCYGM